ncbi:MAG: hypothetical protein U0174_20190 [Polyangiaceae bacterium]
MRSLCSEFPCDNPSLHFGGTWVQLETTGEPTFEKNEDAPPAPVAVVVEAAPRETGTLEVSEIARDVMESEGEVLDVAAEQELSVEGVEIEPETTPEPRTSGIFLSAEVEPDTVVTAPVVEAVVDETREPATSDDSPSDDDAVEVFCALLEEVAIQFGGESAAEVVSSWLRDEDSPLAEERSPWLSLLRGDECDLSTASAATLDEWASKMLSRASGRDAGEIRRELRNRGVAAYGLLAA